MRYFGSWAADEYDLSQSWIPKAPKSLVVPFGHATTILQANRSIGQLVEVAARSSTKISQRQYSASANEPSAKTHSLHDKALGQLAEQVVLLRDAAREGCRWLPAVEVDFGAAAVEVAEYRGSLGTSYVQLVIELAVEDIELIGSQLDLTDEPGTNAYCTFTAERLLHCFKETGFRLEVFDDLLPVLTVHEYGRVLFNLRQELFRAWKRKYPNDESKYETLLDTGDDEAVSKALPWLAPPNTDRPCAPRDYQFFLWSLEGMGPAKIRDRWDGMSDEERKRISPKCWNRIGEASKRQGAQTAKQGVKRAKADLGLEQCGVNELRRRLREPG